MTGPAQLLVTIFVTGSKVTAVTTDGLKCLVADNENKDRCAPGDQWTARAVSGRVMGQKGQGMVELLTRTVQGFVTSVQGHWMDEKNLVKIQIYLTNGLHALITGPPGSGKTTFARRFAKSRNWGFLQVDCMQALTVRDMFGADAVSNGSTRFIPSELTLWLEKVASEATAQTHLLIFDELNRAQGKAANALLGLLGPDRSTVIPTIEGSRSIVLPRNVAVLATANIGREYTGTAQLDKALENRFMPVDVGYAPVNEAVELLHTDPRFSKVTKSDIRRIVVAAQVLNEQFQGRQSLHAPPSFRGIEGALSLRGFGWPVRDCIEHGFLTQMNTRERADMWNALTVRFDLDSKKEIGDEAQP